MVEVSKNPVCFTCPAKSFVDSKYICDPSKLDGEYRRRPLFCPETRQNQTKQESAKVQTILRMQLRK